MLHLCFDENGVPLGELLLRRKNLPKHLRITPSVISILPVFSKERERVESFITDIYADSYNANIKIHYPTLMSVRDQEGRILAAAGFRYAEHNTLFLEQYLTAPVEQVLNVSRAQIVEIGNLASKGNGASLFLFAALSAYLHCKGFTQAVATSTAHLEQRFQLLGLQPVRHAKADPALLLFDDEHWGSYHEKTPYVISGSIRQGYEQLQHQLGLEYSDCEARLLPRLHYNVNAGEGNYAI